MGDGQRGWWKGPRRVRRVHGLQWPLHPQQVLAWLVMGTLTALMYGAVLPALHSTYYLPLAIVTGLVFTAHILTHIIALALDPADPQLRSRKNRQQIPEFDRTMHNHVIENGRCHLCNITISSSRTKHCSACNKCVDVFDHHCKWLNHCVGKRNYRVFLACVLTAIICCLLIMGICLAEIILYYFNRQYLFPWEAEEIRIRQQAKHKVAQLPKDKEDDVGLTCAHGSPYCHFKIFGAFVYDGAFIGLLSTLFSVALVAEVLLIHLAAFHAYIICLGFTTYEYIRGHHLRGSNSAHSFSTYGRDGGNDREGAVCGWTVARHSNNNQITPSSTTDTALLSTLSVDSLNIHSANRSPRSSTSSTPGVTPTTPGEMINGRIPINDKFVAIQRQKYQSSRGTIASSPPNTAPRTPPNRLSSVPQLPQIHIGRTRAQLRTLSRAVSTVVGEYPGDEEVEVRMVALPRPRPNRRRLRSSVAPHLSPIKECDQTAPSPPSVRASCNGSATGSPADSPMHKSYPGSPRTSPGRTNLTPKRQMSPLASGANIKSKENGHSVIHSVQVNGRVYESGFRDNNNSPVNNIKNKLTFRMGEAHGGVYVGPQDRNKNILSTKISVDSPRHSNGSVTSAELHM